MTNDDDEDAARVFATLADPRSLRLLLHVLSAGPGGRTLTGEHDMAPGESRAQLARLTAAGLLEETQAAAGPQAYRVTDADSVERLLAAARRLGPRDDHT